MRRTLRGRLAAVMLAVLAAGGAGRPAQAQFSVSPAILPFEAAAGETSATVTVRNEGDRAMQFRITTGAFAQMPDGSHVYEAAADGAHACGERLSAFPGGATLAPGEVLDVLVSLQPGTSTCWSGVFVETRDWGAQGVTIGQRVMVKAYGIAAGAATSARIAATDASVAGDTVRVAVTFANEGERPLRPSGRLEVRTLAGEVVATLPIAAFSALPGHTRELSLAMAAPAAGRYVAVPILDIGEPDLIGGQAPFRVADAGGG